MQSLLLSIAYAYDRQQVIYIFDKMRVEVNTQKSHVKNVIHRDCRQTDDIRRDSKLSIRSKRFIT